MTVAVALTDLAVFPVDEDFDAIAAGAVPPGVGGLVLRAVHRTAQPASCGTMWTFLPMVAFLVKH